MAQGEADRARPARRVTDLAVLTPVIAFLMLMPPIIGLFAKPEALILSVPLILVYLLGLWLAMIVAAYLIARNLKRGVARRDE